MCERTNAERTVLFAQRTRFVRKAHTVDVTFRSVGWSVRPSHSIIAQQKSHQTASELVLGIHGHVRLVPRPRLERTVRSVCASSDHWPWWQAWEAIRGARTRSHPAIGRPGITFDRDTRPRMRARRACSISRAHPSRPCARASSRRHGASRDRSARDLCPRSDGRSASSATAMHSTQLRVATG